MNKPDLKDLKKIIIRAEKELEDLHEKDVRHAKQRRIKRALERAYTLLNSSDYTQKQVDKMTRVVWRSLQDGIPLIWFWSIGVLLFGSLVFTAYETFSFFGNYLDLPVCRPGTPWWVWCRPNPNPNPNPNPDRPDNPDYPVKPRPEESSSESRESSVESSEQPNPVVEDDLSNLVTVNYVETNIVNLTNLIPVSDEVGLKNKAQEFNITNDSSKLTPGIEYDIRYIVNIVELNQNIAKVINNKYIRYRLTYDNYYGEKVVVDGNIGDLKKNADGSFEFISGSQKKDATSNFNVIFWIDSSAGNDQQGASYLMAFKTTAVIDRR